MSNNRLIGIGFALLAVATAITGCSAHDRTAATPPGSSAATGAIPPNGTAAQQQQAIVQAAQSRRTVMQSSGLPMTRSK